MALRKGYLVCAAMAAPVVFAQSQAFAQSANGPTRDEIEGKTLPKIEPQNNRLSVEGGIEYAPCPLADPRYGDVKVTFNHVEFANLQGVSPAALNDSWREFAGHSVPLSEVCEIRDHAATILRKAGYLAAVQVMPQRISPDGILKFDVLMAKLVRVQVRGDAGPSEKLIARLLEPLAQHPVFNANEAERIMLLARDIPGYDVRLTLRPAGTVPGEVVAEVAVTHTSFEVEANIQNLASPDTGRFGGLLGFKINGLTCLGDQTTASIYDTFDVHEQTIVQAGHSFLAGSSGLRLAADITYAWTSPTLNPPAPIKSKTLVFGLSAMYPIIRRQTRNLFATGGFELINQNIRFGPVPLTQDKLRIIYGRLDFDQIDPESLSSTKGYSASEPHWRIGGMLELRQGISAFGASRACGTGFINCLPPFTPLTRVEADPTAFVARAQSYMEFRPIPDVTLSVVARGQYAPHPLASYEEFTAGNYTVGRGYEAGTLLGDSGIGTQSELRLFKLQPKSRDQVSVQPYAFFDAARVWNKDVFSPPYAAGRTNLYSAGGGIRAAWGNRARIDVGIAIPLKSAGLLTKKGDARFLMSFTFKLLPWRH
jgi:hemolysin activation/secretion protein